MATIKKEYNKVEKLHNKSVRRKEKEREKEDMKLGSIFTVTDAAMTYKPSKHKGGKAPRRTT